MNDKEKRVALEALISSLADDLRETVADIEAGPQFTKDHYEAYMTMMGAGQAGAGEGKAGREVVALALVKAGANRTGVVTALKLSTGESLL